MKKIKNIGDLLVYIRDEILPEDDKNLKLVVGEDNLLIEVFCQDYPITIEYVPVWDRERLCPLEPTIVAEIDSELLTSNIGIAYLEALLKICKAIEDNKDILKDIIKCCF